MSGPVVVGVDGRERDRDALALGRLLGRLVGAELVLACVFAHQPHLFPADRAVDRMLRDQAEATLAQAQAQARLGDDVAARQLAVPSRSAPRGLQAVAQRLGAQLVVVGSTRSGRLARVLPGSTSERALHASPCPVAVAPLGYHAHAPERLGRVAMAYDDLPEARHALGVAASLAQRAHAELELVGVAEFLLAHEPLIASGPGYTALIDELAARLEARLSQAIAELPGDLAARAIVLRGNAAERLAQRSAAVDLLVLGSRGYGPLGAVLLGGVSGRLLRTAACPVIVVPRGARDELGDGEPGQRPEAPSSG